MKLVAALIAVAWVVQPAPAQAPGNAQGAQQMKERAEQPSRPGVPFLWNGKHRWQPKEMELWADVG
jgi:hypothetical protein